MGFAETGASNLRNNKRIVGSRGRMNDAHLKIDKTVKSGKDIQKKMSTQELQKFREELAADRKIENRKNAIILGVIFTIVLFLVLFFGYG